MVQKNKYTDKHTDRLKWTYYLFTYAEWDEDSEKQLSSQKECGPGQVLKIGVTKPLQYYLRDLKYKNQLVKI